MHYDTEYNPECCERLYHQGCDGVLVAGQLLEHVLGTQRHPVPHVGTGELPLVPELLHVHQHALSQPRSHQHPVFEQESGGQGENNETNQFGTIK